jgi:hypothetical protein
MGNIVPSNGSMLICVVGKTQLFCMLKTIYDPRLEPCRLIVISIACQREMEVYVNDIGGFERVRCII